MLEQTGRFVTVQFTSRLNRDLNLRNVKSEADIRREGLEN